MPDADGDSDLMMNGLVISRLADDVVNELMVNGLINWIPACAGMTIERLV